MTVAGKLRPGGGYGPLKAKTGGSPGGHMRQHKKISSIDVALTELISIYTLIALITGRCPMLLLFALTGFELRIEYKHNADLRQMIKICDENMKIEDYMFIDFE